MKYFISIFMVAAAITINAQTIERQVIGSSGGTFTDGTIELTSTVGEPTIETYSSGTITLTQGYQQAEDVSTTINEVQVTATYKLYPNPTIGNATLAIMTQNTDADVSILVYTIDGKLVSSKSITLLSGVESLVQVNLVNQANGVYFVNILDSKSDLSEVIQLVKN